MPLTPPEEGLLEFLSPTQMFIQAVTIISIPPGLVRGFSLAGQDDDYHHPRGALSFRVHLIGLLTSNTGTQASVLKYTEHYYGHGATFVIVLLNQPSGGGPMLHWDACKS